ncbi:MAG TPA: DinB family protein, partial [Gemmatimonadaceae bacterium]
LLEGMTWDQAMSPWTCRAGDRVIRQAPRAEILRAFVLAHSTHHRAQLGVYLRLLGIPIPGSYGPSADEA